MAAGVKEVVRFFSKPKNKLLLLIMAVALIGAVVAGCFVVFGGKICGDESCFSVALVKCSRVSYVKNAPETSLFYTIRGKTLDNKNCKIDVKLIQVRAGSAELYSLEGKQMNCLTPLGIYLKPEEKIEYCHGLLKEGVQEIMIQRMHSQLVENMIDVSERLTSVLR